MLLRCRRRLRCIGHAKLRTWLQFLDTDRAAYRVPKPAFCGSDDLGELRFTSCGVQHTETAYGSYGMVSIDWPSQCSTSLLLKRKPRSSVIQFSADSRGNWPCHLPILQSQPEHTVGVSRIRATQ